MSMGSTMMQQAELRRKEDGAKSRPSSVSKIQIAVTGAASLIPGSQVLSACELDLGALFIRARNVNFNVVTPVGTTLGVTAYFVGDLHRGQSHLTVMRFGQNVKIDFYEGKEKPSPETLTDCYDSYCPLFKTVIKAWDGSAEEFSEAFLILREKAFAKLHFYFVRHDKDRQYQPHPLNWLSRLNHRRIQKPEKPEKHEKPEEPEEPEEFEEPARKKKKLQLND